MKPQCESCEIVYINGTRCHEVGCPDAWRELTKSCFECGCAFTPKETRFESVCEDCIKESERSES